MSNVNPTGSGANVDPVVVLANGAVVESSNPLPVTIGSTPPYSSGLTALNVSVSSSGDNTVVAAVTGETIRLYSLALTFASPVDLTIKNGAGTSLGVFQGITSFVMDPFYGNSPRWVLTAGNALIFNMSSAVACKGTIWYTQE